MRLSNWTIVLLMAMIFAAFTVGVVAAAPAGTVSATTSVMEETITPTASFTHPVGLAISAYFSIPYTTVMSLHDSGVGFGVIARAYLTAKFSNGVLTPTQVLELHESGVGWGQIMHEYGVHPGRKGLGSIMGGGTHGSGSVPSTSNDSLQPPCPGNSCNAPGHNKHKK
jgi:hypothetical protein